VGFQDDNEALEAELTARKARRDAERQTANSVAITSSASRVVGGSSVPRATGGSELGDGQFGDSQENWFVPQEGATDPQGPVEESEGLVADQEELDVVGTVGV
jgi:hypothetical protein